MAGLPNGIEQLAEFGGSVQLYMLSALCLDATVGVKITSCSRLKSLSVHCMGDVVSDVQVRSNG